MPIFSAMRANEELIDVVFKVRDTWEVKETSDILFTSKGSDIFSSSREKDSAWTSFPCHRLVVAAGSTLLHRMLTSGMKECGDREITLCGVEAWAFELLLTFMYESKI